MAQLRAGDSIFPQPPIDKVEITKRRIEEGVIDINKPDFGDKKINTIKDLIISTPHYYWANSDDAASS